MGDSEINFDDKIIPHRLEGIDREDWLDELWRIFTELSTAGTINMTMLQTVVDELNIEGDDTFLERYVPKEKWSKITYEEFVQYLDERSRAASEDFVETSSVAEVGVEKDTEVVESSGGPFSRLKSRISDCCSSINITPKITLIAATSALMILVSVALIVGLAVVWKSTSTQAEKDTVHLMHIAAERLIEDLEEEVIEDKASGLIQVATMISVWLGAFADYNTVETQSLVEDRLLRMALAMNQKVAITHARSNDIVFVDEADILASYLEDETLGDTLNLLNESTVRENMVPGFMIIVPCGTTGSSAVKFTGGNICVMQNETAMDEELIRSATSDVESLNSAAESAGRQTTGYVVPLYHTTAEDEHDLVEAEDVAVHSYYEVNISAIPSGMCLDETMQPLCDDFVENISRTSDRGTYSWSGINFFKNSSMSGAGYSLKDDVFILGLVEFDNTVLNDFQGQIIEMVNAFNQATGTTQDEITIATINDDEQITFPATDFKPGSSCRSDVCEWPLIAHQVIELLFSSGENGWSIIPNYLPKAIIAAHYLSPIVKMGILVHVDVLEVRSHMSELLAAAIDELNSRSDEQADLHIFQQNDIPKTRIFLTSEECPEDVYCLPTQNTSTPNDLSYLTPYFRYDCIHCEPIDRPFADYGAVSSITTGGDIFVSHTETIVKQQQNGADVIKVDGNPYVRSYSFMHNFSFTLATLQREDIALEHDNYLLGVAVGCAVGFLGLGVALLCYLFFNSFDLIEKDWAAYKSRIERERAHFSHLVKGLLPPHIAERLIGGNRVLIDQVPGSAFLFADLCGFTNESKGWQPKHIGRYVTYCFAVMEEVAHHHNVIKIRTVGDLFCAVALRETDKTKTDSVLHPTCRVMDTAAMLMSLFSANYEHMPQHSRFFRDVFKDRLNDGKPTVMPALRIGIHSASVVGGAYSIGNASHFDFYGPGPAVANRLQQTASPGRIHVSHVIRDTIRQWGKRNMYTFDQQRKTICRGQGTISSYYVKTMLLEIPTSITEPLGMRRATKRVDFSVKTGTKDNSSYETSQNSQDHSSGN